VQTSGRRCPNAAIGDSSYCGLPTHQALARFETNQAAVLAPLEEAEVAILADPGADDGQVREIVAKAESQFEEASAAGPVAAEEASDLTRSDTSSSTPPAEEASEDGQPSPEEGEEAAGDEGPQADDVAEEAEQA
jgi:N utilization substance protein A